MERDQPQPLAGNRGFHGCTAAALPLPFTLLLCAALVAVQGCATYSDKHLGSKYERLDVMRSLYNWFAAEKVDRVFDAGNWAEGDLEQGLRLA